MWLKENSFKARIIPSQKPFVIVLPPPNITGNLHMGHALNCTIQDILIRYHRLKGVPTLWLPGTDHAGIAMQYVVERDLMKNKNLTKNQIGRKEFEKKLWQWKNKYGRNIINQIKTLGASCDWSRERFTLDDSYKKSVLTAFIHYYKKGYIYRDYRLINWCPRCQTVLSDLEVVHKEEKGYLWYIKYPLKKEKKDKVTSYIVVATTRPETMLGDTAVAVNPQDKRYKNLIGQKVILPLTEKEIPIIADERVDKNFGTGAVKVTPAHDAIDYEIGQSHQLEKITVIGFDGRMTSEAGQFENLLVKDARIKIVEELKKLGYLEKIEPHIHSVGLCERCGTIIEPLISKQWFIKMKKLAQPAIKVVEQDKIQFIPVRWKKVYLNWMKGIKDWCISRQLWWGHQIPVWYCDNCDFLIAKINKPRRCPSCKYNKFTQDPDVLDTWFSSALWPFATLGWPRKTKDLQYFYPTTILTTAREILYLWVARMIFSGLEFMKKHPFQKVFIHAMVLDEKGRKMSKSKGNVIDPLKLIENYGADATRFGLIYQMAWGQDLSFQENRIIMGKKFCNKIWNASRFVLMNSKNINLTKCWQNNFGKNLTEEDKKVIKKLKKTIKDMEKSIEDCRFGQAASQIYSFFWHDFCDNYIEKAKIQIKEKKESTICVLLEILESSLKLLHPFIPFITEEVWQIIRKENYPLLKKYYQYKYKTSKIPRALVVSFWPKK